MVRSNIALAAAVLASSASALEVTVPPAADSLYSSSRLSKRFIDDDGNYNISLYHINDVHAHLDEFSSSGTDCTAPAKGCYGGYARIKTVIDATRPSHPDSLLLNAGDEFQGTLFYSYYKGEKIAETLNQLGFDGMTLGNHEFDGGDNELGDFLQNLTFPIISANIVSDNPKLNATIKPFHIYEKYGLAVIGVTTETTKDISSPGQGTIFTDPAAAVQRTIDHIKATTNITRFAALTHIGYEQDIALAKATTGLHLIMGGHSHTLIGDMAGAAGKYPTIEKNSAGEDVFVVTAYRWGEYLGYIDVTYDKDGKILAYNGAPIHITNTTAQDEGLQAQIDAWRVPFEEFSKQVVGESNVVLDQSLCQTQECVLGNFITDAMLQYRLNNSSPAAFAFTNAGGIRATIDAGPITRGEVLTAFPFGNAVVELTFSGADLWKTIEGWVSRKNQFSGKDTTSWFQVSRGIEISYNPNLAQGGRLVRVLIDGKPLDRSKTYTVVTIDFLANGGDSLIQATKDFVVLDTLDEVLVDYIGFKTPVNATIEGRQVKVDRTPCVRRKARRS